jgi:phosphoenolpyruvate---glycerone phosphotransferase subunit DhaM
VNVGIIVVSHSGKIAEGAMELAAQMAPDVRIIPAGGTSDGRIGTSLEKVMAALEQADGGDGIVVLADLGSAVMTAESALEFAGNPSNVLLADAPLVEGLVAAAVAAQNGAGMHARPAAKIAGGVAGMDVEMTVNGVDGASMTGLMTLGAGKGSVLHVEASGPDAERAVKYVGSLVRAGFGEP